MGVGLGPLVGVGDGVLVGFGVGDGVGEGVGVFVGLAVGVGLHPAIGHLRGTIDAALAGIILSTTKNIPEISIHKTINTIIIAVPLLRLSILFDITYSFIVIQIHTYHVHPKICVFLTTNTSAAPALTIINSNR